MAGIFSRAKRRSIAALLALPALLLAPSIASGKGVDSTRLSLPKGPGSVEGLAMQDLSPSLSTGSASYEIPIAVPPAVGAFGPSLSLTYDSGAGVSELGIGWRLAGVAKIRRRTENGLPHFDATDPFEIVGVGTPGELLEVSPGTYRPQYEDGTFVRVERSPDRSQWEARTKESITLRFGGSGFTEAEGGRVASYLLREQLDRHGHQVRYEWDASDGHALLKRVVWNDSSKDARNELEFLYQDRPDHHRRFSSGIEERLTRRIASIVVRHGGALVRRYEIGYGGERHPSLSSVTLIGSDGVSALPAARFEYTAEKLELSSRALVTMANAPGRSPGEPNGALADMNGDGLPDLLVAEAGRYRTYVNNDGQKWLAAQDWTAEDSPSVSLSSAGVQLADVDADGAPDLLVKSGVDSFRYFPRAGATRFGAPVTLRSVPSFSFEDPEVRLGDLDGDRRTDVIVTTPAGIAIGYNTNGTDWTEPAMVGPVDRAQELRFSDGHTQLCDVNGDRVLDFCRLRSGGLMYWLGRGRGAFEAGEEATGVPAFDVSAPYRLEDLNGDGWVDLVRVGVDSVSYALATAEGAFASVQTLAGTPAHGPNTGVEFADMNGSGTTDIVWIDVTADTAVAWRYLELFPDGRSGLLRRIDNGLGKVQSIEYEAAAQSAGRARDLGEPWTTRINIATPVVRRVTADLSLGDPLLVTDFDYRNGAYDAAERTFAGFGGGTQTQRGDNYTPTLVTDSTFDLGLEHRVLRGRPLVQETRTEEGAVFSRTTSNYALVVPATGMDGRSIEYAYRSSELDEHIEEGIAPARRTFTEFVQDDFGNPIEERRWGEVIGNDKLAGDDETITTRTFANNAEDWLLGFVATETVSDGRGARVAMVRKYYDGEAFTGLSLGQVSRGDVTREESWIGPDPNAFELVNSTRYDAHGNPLETRDGVAGGRRFSWTDDGAFLASEQVILDGGVDLTERAETEPVYGNVVSVTLYSGERTRYEYDAFGRLTKTIRVGDSSESPTIQYRYEVAAPISRIVTLSRVWSGKDVVDRSDVLQDGSGHKRGTLTQDGSQWLLAGVALFDARGAVRRELLPRWVEPSAEAAPPLLTDSPRGRDVFHDALGREIRTRSAMGVETHTTYAPLEVRHYDGGQADVSSPYEHTPTITRVDGQGRTAEHTRTLDGKPQFSRYTHDAAGRLLSRTDPEGHVSAYLYDGRGRRIQVSDPDLGTYGFVFDAIGNTVRRTFPDGRIARFTFDLAGRPLTEDYDGDGKAEVENVYDHDPSVRDDASSRGKLVSIIEPTGKIRHTYDPRGRVKATTYTIEGIDYTVGSEYDAQDREVLHVYPDGSSIATTRNARGQIERYGTDLLAVDYDEDGLEIQRRFGTGVTIESAYDEDRRRTDLHVLDARGRTLAGLHWAYDAAGNLTSVDDRRPGVDADHDRGEAYAYDNLYRLVGAEGTWGKASWRYSQSGNLLSRESSAPHQTVHDVRYDGRPHAPTAFDGRAIQYDACGRMIGDGERAYTWNDADQLVRVDGPGGAFVKSGFGAEGVRRLRVERGADGREHTTRFVDAWSEVKDGKLVRYVFHGGQRIARLAEGNGVSPASGATVAVRRPTAPGSLMKLAGVWLACLVAFVNAFAVAARRCRPALAATLALAALGCAMGCGTDHGASSEAPQRGPAGSVERLTNADTLLITDLLGSLHIEASGSGDTRAEFATYPFGVTRFSTSTETRLFAASPRDTAVDLDQMGARSYAPDLGVWTSGDPVVVTDPERLVTADFAAANPYAYAKQSPVIGADHDGHFWHIAIGAAAGALIGGGVEAARQYAANGKVEDWGRIGAAATAGAVSGTLSSMFPGAGFVSAIEGGAINNVATGITERLLASGGKSAGTLKDVVIDAGVGAITGGVAHGAALLAKSAVAKIGQMRAAAALARRPTLPPFDGKTTHGVLVTIEGQRIPLQSGGAPAGYRNYVAAGHVEGKAAITIREGGSRGGTVYHNNTNGTCGYCNAQVSTLLPEGAQLSVVPPANAMANNSKAVAVPTTYVGNSAIPKAP